ncbi:ribbon-helix-helix domain-containing protein [Novosphingopyxis sp.]|uniref:ribbon-helix-helix domain-containing protein n=1 Tax=Novosphingopyxis sp. TaxID=2709690 RepID=UPI003B5AC1BC
MSRKPSFANLRDKPDAVAAPQTNTTEDPAPRTDSSPAPSRKGRKQIAAYFTPDMSFAMHTLARRQGRSLQALMAEAFNDVLRKHGESPIGD